MDMSLIPKVQKKVHREHKFSMKPSCDNCDEVYDNAAHIPKILDCGHSLCMSCIDKIINSIKVCYYGDGEVQKSFNCTICNKSMAIPPNGAVGFSTNFQLVAAIKSDDIRLVSCTECSNFANENTFRICRECTIEKYDYDIKELRSKYGDKDLTLYAVCSDCVLRNHNDGTHTILDFYPLRAYWYKNKYFYDVNKVKAALMKSYKNARVEMAKSPMLVDKTENEIKTMVDFLGRCKSSRQQQLVLKKYTDEMGQVTEILETLKKAFKSLNEHLSTKAEKMKEDNELTNGMCFAESKKIEELLSKCFVKPKEDPQPDVPASDEEGEEKEDDIETLLKNEVKDHEPLINPVNQEMSWKTFFSNIWELILISTTWAAQSVSSFIERAGIIGKEHNIDYVARIGLQQNIILSIFFILFILTASAIFAFAMN